MMNRKDLGRASFLLLLVLTSIEISAQGVRTPSEPAELSNSFWSLTIQDADTGNELVAIRPHHLMTPASTMKLVSTATLWSQKGGGYRIPTEICTDGKVTNGTLEGNLYIIGHGDPSVGSRYFWNSDQDAFFKHIAEALKAQSISAIKGDVIALSGIENAQANNPRWLAYDMGNAYATGIWSLNAYDNACSIHFTNNGSSYTVEPDVVRLKLTKMYDITSSRSRDSIYISPFVLPDGSYAITGAYPGNVGKLRVRAAIPNPPLFVADRLRSLMQRLGITVSGEASTTPLLPNHPELLYKYESPATRELMRITLVYSHNLFAEGILYQVGADKAPAPGHNRTQTSIEEVYRYWKGRGLDTRELEMLDGSGLSPENKVTTSFLASMLGKVHRADKTGSYMRLLPRAGKDGTLTGFLKNTPLEGKAYLKSGTLRNVVCYAGYVQLNGKTYTVALMVNNFYGKASTVRRGMERILLEAFAL